jgi:hypothetical protein
VILTFGKHKNKALDDVPAGYLRWLLRQCELRAELRTAIEEVVIGKARQRWLPGFEGSEHKARRRRSSTSKQRPSAV